MKFVDDELAALERGGRMRRMRAIDGAQDRVVTVDGREVVNFSANDYLGLAKHPALRDASASALVDGSGAGASRLVVGNLRGHRELEASLARWYGAGRTALAFNSGYQANVGVLQALAGRGDEVFSDELNHASLIDGCRLSRAAVTVYRHRAVDELAARLEESRARRKIIVSDSVYSMDGDRAPVARLAEVARTFDAMLILDEAHAVGTIGPAGRGVAADAGVVPDVLVGTLGKAFGSFGAFVLAEERVIRLLVNRARSFVFTTALPPAVVAASRAAVELAGGAAGDRLRIRLSCNIKQLSCGLRELGVADQGFENTAIFPILVGDDRLAMECAEQLLERGLYAQGIRPPTVPSGTARLRVALTASHTAEDIDQLLGALAELTRLGKVPRHAA